jgi:DNA-binding IclR family transcriptional regulator
VLYLAVLESAEGGRATSGRRTHRPLIRSGVGHALLSIEEDRFIERVYRRSLARGFCDRNELPLKALMQQIEACRSAGYAFVRDTVNPTAAIVAAPVPVTAHAQRLAIAIGGPAERIVSRVAEIGAILLDHILPLAQQTVSAVTDP